jgi:hypothetical protein
VKLPNSLKDIKVKQYQTIAPLLSDLNLDTWINIMSILSGKTTEQIEDIDTGVFKKYRKQLQFLLADKPQFVKKYLWINGSLYKGTNNADDLNTSQYVAIKTFLSQGSPVEQLHNIAPCCYKKLTFKGWKYNGDDHVKLSEAFLNKPTSDVLPLVFFCFRVLYNSTIDSEAYLEAQKVIANRMEEIHQLILDESFLNTGVGTPQ